MSRFKIDEVGRETGMTKRAIRYYEEIGLFQPAQRSDGGIRLYSKDDILQLKKLNDARQIMGFSLQEVKAFVTLNESIERHRNDYQKMTKASKRMEELDEIEKGLNQQWEMINKKMKKMEQFKKEVEDLLEELAHLKKRG